ncbi:MAG TPA: hypothetical protein VHQ41_01200 [Patescibacteria group bacterium]|jgi:hypothetical protein|nr:hypothetical protein [Patescibacteria group bacterium]
MSISLISWIQKPEKTPEDWLYITKRLESRISSLVDNFSLMPLGKIHPCSSNSPFQICDLDKKLMINSEEITLRTQGIYGTLFFDGLPTNRSEIRTRYRFGYTRENKWLSIAVTYHESPDGTRYECFIDKIEVSETDLENLLKLTPYKHIIWEKFNKITQEWYLSSKQRMKEVGKIRQEYELINQLMY